MALALHRFLSSSSHHFLARSRTPPSGVPLSCSILPNLNFHSHSDSFTGSDSDPEATIRFPPFRGRKMECRSLGDVTRTSFPVLNPVENDSHLIYLNGAATSQKPLEVFQALSKLDKSCVSTIHRDVHSLRLEANDLYELARSKVAALINSVESRNIVFTRNATEAINLVAFSWGFSNIRSGDEILLTVAEHHSAIVPWQLVAKKTGATLKYVGLSEEGVLSMEQLKKLLSKKTKLVVTHHVSNMLGSVLPIDEIVTWSHDVGAKVLVDACQSVSHMVVDVQKLDVDFLVASSHKMCGPTGVGFLYGKSEILSAMPPFLGGRRSVADVFLDHPKFADYPARFEAGTPSIAEAVGLASAIDYLSSIGVQKIHEYEMELAEQLYRGLVSIPNLHVYGPVPSAAVHRAPLCSFNVKNILPADIAALLCEMDNVVICSGHHCAQPLHRSLGINASARVSARFYNTDHDVCYFMESLEGIISFLKSYRRKNFWRRSGSSSKLQLQQQRLQASRLAPAEAATIGSLDSNMVAF